MKIIREPQTLNGFFYENPIDRLPAVIHCGEAEVCKGHWLKPHSHRCFEFLLMVRGSADWVVDKKSISQQAMDLFIVRPQQIHASGQPSKLESHHLWVGLRLNALGTQARRLERRLLKAPAHLLHDCKEMEAVLRGLVTQSMAFRPFRNDAAKAYIDAFLSLVEQAAAMTRTNPRNVRVALPYSYGTQKAIAYMERHPSSRISLAEMAKVASFRGIPHFCTQFRREVGVTPAAYHIQLRLNGARDALRHQEIPITTIAHQYGFSSSQHFSTAFRKLMKCSPREWRQGAGRTIKPAPTSAAAARAIGRS